MKQGHIHRRSVIPVVVLALPVAISVACYAPTEITIDITTDLPCASPKPTTAIYKQAEKDPVAVTRTCETAKAPGGDTTIGTLTFVPSGDRDGAAAVRVVLVDDGSDASTCEQHPEHCIFASRSFSFVEHLARRLPIRMLAECLGKQCPAGETCDVGGVCRSNKVDCSSEGCPSRDPTPIGTASGPDGGPPVDASTPVEGGPPPATCAGPFGNGVLAMRKNGVPGEGESVFGNDAFYFMNAPTKLGPINTGKLSAVTLAGVVSSERTLANGEVFVALTATPVGWALLTRNQLNMTALVSYGPSSGGASIGDDDVNPVLSITGAFEKTAIAYVSRADGVDKVVLDSASSLTPFSVASGGDTLVADGEAVYLATGSGTQSVSRADGTAGKNFALGPSPDTARVAFTSFNGQAFAAGVDSTGVNPGNTRIVALKGLADAPQDLVATKVPVQSLAVDADDVFWSDGNSIWRASRATGSPVLVVEGLLNEQRTNLVLAGGCLYFWSLTPDSPDGLLQIRTKY